MPLLSYARNGEDIVLHRALRDIARGRYIDVGARRPGESTATRLFYERGWSGINVIPGRDDHALFVAERPRDLNLNVVAAARSGLLRSDHAASDDSRDAARAGSRETPGLSLADICEGARGEDVHLLRIEARGGERDVLEGADFTTFRPWIILVHAGDGHEAERAEQPWRKSLEQAGYRWVLSDGMNLFFLAEEHSERREALGTPANAHDDFVPAAIHEAEARAAELEQLERAAAGRHAGEMAELRETLQRETTARQAAESALAGATEAASLLGRELEALGAAHRRTTSRNVRLQSMLDHQATHFRQQLFESRSQIDELKRQSLDASSLVEEFDRHRLDADRLRKIYALFGDPERATRLDEVWRLQRSFQVKLGAWRAEAEAEVARLNAELAAAREQERMLLASTSWRVTEPLRRLRKATHVLRRQPRLVPGIVYRQMRRFAGRSPASAADAVTPEASRASPFSPRFASLQVAEDLAAVASRVEHAIEGVGGLLESISTVVGEVDASKETPAKAVRAADVPERERQLAAAIAGDVARRRREGN